MKKTILKSILLATISLSTLSATDGATIFQSNGCTMCHKKNQESVGPSLQTISMYYAAKENALVSYLQGRGTPIVDPNKANVMKDQLLKLRGLFDEEYRSLARYILDINMNGNF